jgi:perosamine synthetase
LTPERWIPVAEPALVGREREYVDDCLRSTWISSAGRYIEEFEAAFAAFCGVRHAIACCNGTVDLHIALLGLGLEPDAEVIVPTFTYVASVNPVVYCGARPVFVDADPTTWDIDVSRIDAAIGPKTVGIIPVHLYGQPAEMGPILELAQRHGLFVVEDAAEAHGALYGDRTVGSIGDCAVFSFYGNKIITTGEGGMIVTDDEELARTLRQLRGQGQDFERRYWFPVVGFNYRMTNVAAAIGLGQLERVDWHIERRREVAGWYREELGSRTDVRLSADVPGTTHAHWMSCALLEEGSHIGRDGLMERLRSRGVETRPFFYPVHTLPPHRQFATGEEFPVAEYLGAHGLNLPSSATLTRDDVRYVASSLADLLDG